MHIRDLVVSVRSEIAIRIGIRDTQIVWAARCNRMDRVRVLANQVGAVEASRQLIVNNRAAEVEVRLALLIRRPVLSERIARVQRFILELEFHLAVECSDAGTLNYIRIDGLAAEPAPL